VVGALLLRVLMALEPLFTHTYLFQLLGVVGPLLLWALTALEQLYTHSYRVPCLE
jgi:hypothetical protein